VDVLMTLILSVTKRVTALLQSPSALLCLNYRLNTQHISLNYRLNTQHISLNYRLNTQHISLMSGNPPHSLRIKHRHVGLYTKKENLIIVFI